MRRTSVRRRTDGLLSLEGTSRLHHLAAVGIVAALAIPAVVMVAVSTVAVLPLLALAAPTGALIGMSSLAAHFIKGWRRSGKHEGAQVVLLHR